MNTIPDSGPRPTTPCCASKRAMNDSSPAPRDSPTVQKEILADLAQGPASLCHDPLLQRLAGAARADLRRRLWRAVHRPRRGKCDIAGNRGQPAIRGPPFADAALHRPRPHKLRRSRRSGRRRALHGTRQHSRIQLLVDSILPGLSDLDSQLTRETLLAQAVEANVRWTMRQILESPEGRERQTEGRREARRRDLRNRNGPRAISRMSGERCPRSRSQISPAIDSLKRLRTRRPSGIATRCRRLGSRARDAGCSR